MFASAEVTVKVGFPEAEYRLASLTRSGWLTGASEGAYDSGLTGLIRVGPLGDVRGASKLVRVYVRDLVSREGSAVLTLRWEATGAGGALFPALDADITLAPAGAGQVRLTLNGAYRPPFAALGAGLDRAILNRVANATVRALLGQIAAVVAGPAEGASVGGVSPPAAGRTVPTGRGSTR